MNYGDIVAKFKANYTKEQLKEYGQIVEFDSLKLASMGHNDAEGYQIFTPDFIVKDMCSAIGDDIFDFNKTVLEPTSGDGAFTVYILKKRLEKALASGNYEIDSLKSLSTIYSIEMDKELIEKQRNNIFTLIRQFANDHKIELPDYYFDFVKCIIVSNFIWAMFNSDNPIDAGLFGTEVAYKMPDAEKGKLKPLDMPVWSISNENIEMHLEGVELW